MPLLLPLKPARCCTVPWVRKGCKHCLGDTSCLSLFLFLFFLALWTLVSPPEVPPCTSDGGAAVGIPCGRKPVSLPGVLGNQAGQKSPGGWLLPRSSAPGEGHPRPTPNLTPAAWRKREAGTVAGKWVAPGGFAAARAGTARSPPAQGEWGLPSRGAGGSVKGTHFLSGFGCFLLPSAPCSAAGRWAGSHLSSTGLPTVGLGGTVPIPGRCWIPGP